MCDSENYFCEAIYAKVNLLIVSVLGQQNQPSWRVWNGDAEERKRQFALGLINGLGKGHLKRCPLEPASAEGSCDINMSNSTECHKKVHRNKEENFSSAPSEVRIM